MSGGRPGHDPNARTMEDVGLLDQQLRETSYEESLRNSAEKPAADRYEHSTTAGESDHGDGMQEFPTSLPQRGGADELVSCESRDVIPVLARESPNFAHGQVECREQANLKNARIDAFQHQRNRVIARVLVEETERIVVLSVEVQEARSAIGVAIGDFQILRQSDSARECSVDIPGDSLSCV